MGNAQRNPHAHTGPEIWARRSSRSSTGGFLSGCWREHGLNATRRRTLAPRSGRRTARAHWPRDLGSAQHAHTGLTASLRATRLATLHLPGTLHPLRSGWAAAPLHYSPSRCQRPSSCALGLTRACALPECRPGLSSVRPTREAESCPAWCHRYQRGQREPAGSRGNPLYPDDVILTRRRQSCDSLRASVAQSRSLSWPTHHFPFSSLRFARFRASPGPAHFQSAGPV